MTKETNNDKKNEATPVASNSTPNTPNQPAASYIGEFEDQNLEKDKTEVFDDIDMASNLALGYAEDAWKNHRAKMLVRKPLHPDFDGCHCIECDDAIHPKRLEMGVDKCTECQEREDKLERRR